MFYFIVRLAVTMLALWLTLNLLPGLRLNQADFVQIQHEFTYEAVKADPEAKLALARLQERLEGAGFSGIQPEVLVAFLGFFIQLFVLTFFVYVGLAIVFWFWNWLLWPVILFFTGQVVVWTFGLFLIVINALLFYWAAGPTSSTIVASEPTWLWTALGGLSFTLWLFVLEGVTGLDSPLKDRPNKDRGYWRVLRRLSVGGRNYFAENRRVAQSLDTVTRYTKDILFDSLPVLGPVRRFFQRIIYWRRKPLINESAAETVRYMLQDLGPTFVKLGQIISSRAEQLPLEWRSELAKLQSQVEPFPTADAKRIITSQLGDAPENIFVDFQPEPLAAASTAQVHRATLPDGQQVVVKVQRPNIDLTVRADLNIMRDLTRLAESRIVWARNADLAGIMNEYADNILLELDYTNEAFNGRLLAANMLMFPAIHVPHIYADLSTSRIMTQEFVRGVKITNVEALDSAGLDRTALAETFMRAIIKQVLFDGFFHGDPHPGNVLVNTESGQIIFLDMGMMGVLTADKRLTLADLIWSLADRDPREIARVVLKLTTSYKQVDEDRFIENVERLFARYTTFADSAMSIGGAMKALFDALYKAGLRLDSELTLALKAMVQAEETVHTLDPNLPLVDAAFTAAKELLVETFDTTAVMDSLRRQVIRGAKETIRSIPSLEEGITNWMQQLMRGRFTVYVDTTDVSKQIREVDATVTSNIRSLSFALLLMGMLIGGGVASTGQSALFPDLPGIAYFIFVGAAVLAGGTILRWLWRWLNTGKF